MPLVISIEDKTISHKHLFHDLRFTVEERSRIGLIGRNGTGKTTLFNILTGKDHDFRGSIEGVKNIRIVATEQEQAPESDVNAIDYVLDHVREYRELTHILETYPDTMGSDIAQINAYTEALTAFSEYNYYSLDERIAEELSNFGLTSEQCHRPLRTLSGGQRRFVELAKVLFSNADLILLDEPTNHMDYVGKALFLKWLDKIKQSVLIISHDRDVLETVDRIIEIKDRTAHSYTGNYQAYLKQNSTKTVTEISAYQSALKELEVLHKQIQAARARKAGAGDSRPKILEERLMRQYEEVKASMKKPSFWIDQQSIDQLDDSVADQYHRYKTKNISIGDTGSQAKHVHTLLEVSNLSGGYDQPLFQHLSLLLRHGDRLHLKGRNGAGKSTVVRLILSALAAVPTDAKLLHGSIKGHPKLKIGLYEQEINHYYLDLTLRQALQAIYDEAGRPLTDQNIKAILSTYLFDPISDQNLIVRNLSGGQKARLQIIRMLCNDPNLLILDEPTNHLDLPSIEELEQALTQYGGAILYISHDSYFVNGLGGDTIVM